MYVFLETSLLLKYPTVQKPIQLKQQVIKIIVKLSSNVYYGKEPKKRGERIPQYLKVCCVSSTVLTAGDTTENKRDRVLPSWSLQSGEDMYNIQKHNNQPK